MRSKKIISYFLVCSLLVACQSTKSYTPELTVDEIRDEEINQQKMVDDITAAGGQPKPWRNRKNMRGQFEEVGINIEKAGAETCVALQLQKNGCYYYFKLSRSEEINAHADGKNIIINTGMMRFVESDDELAVVMAHEFVHNLMQHIKAQNQNATFGLLVGMAADAMAGVEGIDTGGEFASAGAKIAAVAYGPEFEKEADYIGLYVMARAGYDINKAAYFWRRMSIEDPESIYISDTHPSNAERFVGLQKTVKEIEYKRKNRLPLVPDFK